jgi:hypothetical protein
MPGAARSLVPPPLRLRASIEEPVRVVLETARCVSRAGRGWRTSQESNDGAYYLLQRGSKVLVLYYRLRSIPDVMLHVVPSSPSSI